MGNFESYTTTVDSLPAAATTPSDETQKPVAIRYGTGTANTICSVVTYGKTKTNNSYFTVVYKADYTTANTINYSASDNSEVSHLTDVATTNFDIEVGAKGGQYAFTNFLTNYTAATDTLNDLSFEVRSVDLSAGTLTPTTESYSNPSFTNIDDTNYTFSALWKYGVLFTSDGGGGPTPTPGTDPEIFANHSLTTSAFNTQLGVTLGTGNTSDSVSLTTFEERECIVNFDHTFVITGNSSTDTIIRINRLSATVDGGGTNTMVNYAFPTDSTMNTNTWGGPTTFSYFEMLEKFQHNNTIVLFGKTASGTTDYGLVVIDTVNEAITYCMSFPVATRPISTRTLTSSDVRLVYTSNDRTAVGIAIYDADGQRLYIANWVDDYLSGSKAVGSTTTYIEEIECAGTQESTGYIMMYRDTTTTIEFAYVDLNADDVAWAADTVATYTSLNDDFRWAKSYDEQMFITYSAIYTDGSESQDFVIHRYSFGTAGGGFSIHIS